MSRTSQSVGATETAGREFATRLRAGDVLTGTIGAFLAQGLDPVRAAMVGCWLHGRAGEIGGETWPAAVPASVLPELVARAWRELEDR